MSRNCLSTGAACSVATKQEIQILRRYGLCLEHGSRRFSEGPCVKVRGLHSPAHLAA